MNEENKKALKEYQAWCKIEKINQLLRNISSGIENLVDGDYNQIVDLLLEVRNIELENVKKI